MIHVVELFTMTVQTELVRMHFRVIRRYIVQYTSEMDNYDIKITQNESRG